MKMRSANLVFCCIAIGLVNARAQTATWTGATNTLWSVSGNWSPSTTPTAGYNILFNGSGAGTSVLDISLTSLQSLTFQNTSPLTLNASGGNTFNFSGGTNIVAFGSNSTVALNVPISGTGTNLWLNGGSGTLTLNPGTGSNTFSGSTEVYANGVLQDGENYSFSPTSDLYVGGGGTPGTVHVNFNELVPDIGDVSGGNGLITIASGKTLYINSIYTNSYSGVISGAGNLEKDGTSTQILTGANTYTGTTVIGTGAALEIGDGTTSGSIASSGVSGMGDLSFSPASGSPISYSGNLTGSLHVDQQGPGMTTLAGTNTYSSATTINGGTLAAGSTSAFGGATGLSAVAINGSGILALGIFSNTIGSLTSSNPLSGVTVGTGATLTIGGSSTTTFKGIVSGAGALKVNGTGELILDGANTYTGGTTIGSNGTLSLGDSVTTGASIPGNVTDNGTLLFQPSLGETYNASGTISGSGAVVVNGANDFVSLIGAVTLSGNNTYGGLTTVMGGEVFVGSNTAFSSGTVTFDNGTELSPSATVTLANPIVLSGGESLDNDDGMTNGLRLTGLVSETGGSGGFTWCTWGTLALDHANTFTGTVDMREGTLLLGNNTAAGIGGTIILDSGTTLSADGTGMTLNIANPIDFTGGSAQFGNADDNNITLSGVIYGSTGSVTYNGGSTGHLTLNNASNSYSIDGNFTIASGTVNAGSNTALGSGSTVALTGGAGLNIMSGVTISNPLSFSGSANVLSGNGTVSSAVSGGGFLVVSPSGSSGNGPGILTFSGTPNGLTLNSGDAIHFDIYNATGTQGIGYSLISDTSPGGLTLTASPNTITFNIVSTDASGNPTNAINFNPATAYFWTFATSLSPINGFNSNQFNLISSGTFLNSTAGGTFSVVESGNNLMLDFTPVPEPSTWALMGVGFLALATFEVRRRQRAKA
jgi:autotransporter-associated beta strand protein